MSLAEVNRHKVTDNVLKTFTLDDKHYAVTAEGIVDLSNYSKKIVNGTVKDAAHAYFKDTEAILAVSTSGIFAFTLASNGMLKMTIVSDDKKDAVQIVDADDALYCIAPSKVYIYSKSTALEVGMSSSTASGTFGSSAFADGKLYSIGQGSKLSAYNCCTVLEQDTGLLSTADIRDF